MSTTVADKPVSKSLEQIRAEARTTIERMAREEATNGKVPDGHELLYALHSCGLTQENYKAIIELHHDAARFEKRKEELAAAQRKLADLRQQRDAAMQERDQIYRDWAELHGNRDVELYQIVEGIRHVIDAAADEERRLYRETNWMEDSLERQRAKLFPGA